MSGSDGAPLDIRSVLDRLESAEAEDLSNEQAAQLLKLAARLYSKIVAREGYEVALKGVELNATDVVVVTSALLRAQNLNPFDLTIWFGQAVLEQPQLKERTQS